MYIYLTNPLVTGGTSAGETTLSVWSAAERARTPVASYAGAAASTTTSNTTML